MITLKSTLRCVSASQRVFYAQKYMSAGSTPLLNKINGCYKIYKTNVINYNDPDGISRYCLALT